MKLPVNATQKTNNNNNFIKKNLNGDYQHTTGSSDKIEIDDNADTENDYIEDDDDEDSAFGYGYLDDADD